METVVIVNSKEAACGVHQYGRRVACVAQESTRYNFVYVEVDSREEFVAILPELNPVAVIYNWHPSTMTWLNSSITNGPKQLILFHEHMIDGFDGYIHTDPSIIENGKDFVVGRPLFEYTGVHQVNAIPVIGTFGFGFVNKGFTRLAEMVVKEFDVALLRMHVPSAKFGDENGDTARLLVRQCCEITAGSGVRVEASHDFKSDYGLLDWLACNSLNAFLYDEMCERGIASVIDYALSVKRPVAISDTRMFRHIKDVSPEITIEKAGSLRAILKGGTAPLEKFYAVWSRENVMNDYERVVSCVIE